MPVHQSNVEYWFRLFYECLHGGCYSNSVNLSWLSNLLTQLWLWIVLVGYILSIIGLIVIVYCIMRLFELRKREEEYYGTLLLAPAEASVNHRWVHIESLIGSTNSSDWRTAIIEADIMLEDMLTRQGYEGVGIGEMLKSVDTSDFNTLNDAWEAHKVRNQIAHQGSTFDLSDTLARRTIAHYEAVFREFRAI